MKSEFTNKEFKLVPPGPKTFELLRNHNGRSFTKSNFQIEHDEDSPGNRKLRICKWCNAVTCPTFRHSYCSTECKISSDIWCYPGRFYSVCFIAFRQDYKCAICSYEWGEGCYIEDQSRVPETDHIIPICHLGEALGVDNHQLICKCCHKIKTKKDLREKPPLTQTINK